MSGESKTSQRRLKARDRWEAALELRKKGLTFEAIASLGIVVHHQLTRQL